MRPSPKSLVLDLLSTLRGRPMPVRALVDAAEVFGMRAESVRVALVRLLERGTIERNERGQYAISRAAAAVQQRVVAWNRIGERLVAWSGAWIGAHTAGLVRGDRARVRRRQRALDFLGLRELEGGLWLRPDNLRGGVEAVRRELIGLGLDEAAPVFGVQHFDASTRVRACALWDAAALRRGYREMRDRLERSAARLSRLADREAMTESFLLGGEAIRLIALDPLLPEPIVPASERGALVEAMRRYDELGRARWKTFMKDRGAPHLRAPRNGQAHDLPFGRRLNETARGNHEA